MSNDQLLQKFVAQRGGSNVYGGPQQPAATSRTTPPKAAPAQTRSVAELDEMARALGEQRKAAEPKKDKGGLFGTGFGGIAGAGLGTVLGGAAGALGFMGRGVVAGLDEFAGTSYGRALGAAGAAGGGDIVAPFIAGDVQDRENGVEDRSWWEKTNDVSYGYGHATVDTGNAWVDNLSGFAGDVVLDPLTYVGGAAVKASAQTTGRVGRHGMAQKLAQAGFSDEVVGEASRRGVAYLDDAAREAVGVGKAGVYFGVGETAVRLPGTKTLGTAIEKGFASTRASTIGRLTDPLNAKLRTIPDLQAAQKVMNAGRTIDGLTPVMAAERVRFFANVTRVAKTYGEMKGREVNKLLRGVDDRSAKALTEALENGVKGEGPDQFRQIFKAIRADLQAKGVKIGDLGENYVPHRWSRKGRRWLSHSPDGQRIAKAINYDPNAEPGVIQHRLFKGGETIELSDGSKFTFPESGTVTDINAAIQKQFGIDGALEDDIRLLLSGYIQEAGRAQGLRQAWTDLAESKSDIMARLDSVGVEELDELAALTANKEVRDLLDATVKARGKLKGKQAAKAADIHNELRKSMLNDLDARIKWAGDDNVAARKHLAAIGKAVKDGGTEDEIRQSFAAARAEAAKELETITRRGDELSESLDALRAQEELAVFGGREAGGAARSGPGPRSKMVEDLQAKVARETDLREAAEDAMERLDDLEAELFEASAMMRQWDEVADSPDLIVELAQAGRPRQYLEATAQRAVVDANAPTAWSSRLKKEYEDATTPEALIAATEQLARRAGDAHGVAVASRRQADKLVGELATVVGEIDVLRKAHRAAGQLTVTPEALQLYRRRAAALKKLADLDPSIKQLSDDVAKEMRALDATERRLRRMGGDPKRTVKERRSTVVGELDVETTYGTGEPGIVEEFKDAYEAMGDADEAFQANRRAREIDLPQGNIPQHLRGEIEAEEEGLWNAYLEAGTRKVELELEINQLADELIGAKRGNPQQGWIRLEELRAEKAKLQSSLADLDVQISAARNNTPERQALREAEKRHDDLVGRIARARSTQHWHEELARNPIREGNSPESIRAAWKTVQAIERAQAMDGTVAERVFVGTPIPGQFDDLAAIEARITYLDDQLALHPEVERAQARDRLGRLSQTGDRQATEAEAEVVWEELENIDDAVRKTRAELNWLKNKRRKMFPQEGGNTSVWNKTHYVSDEGVPVDLQTLSKAEYDAAAKGATPTIGGRRSGAGQRGMQATDPEGSATAARLAGDESADTVGYGGSWDEQAFARMQDGDPYLVDLNEEIKLAEAALKGAEEQSKILKRAYGLKGEVGAGYPYGRVGDMMMVMRPGPGVGTNPKSGLPRFKMAAATSTTPQELRAEAVAKGLVSEAKASKMRHNELGNLLGYNVQYYKKGTPKMDRVPASTQASFHKYIAKQRIAEMSMEGRRRVMADARYRVDADYFAANAQRRVLEKERRKVVEQYTDLATARQGVMAQREEAGQRVAQAEQGIADVYGEVDAANVARTQREGAEKALSDFDTDMGVQRVSAAGREQAAQQERAATEAELSNVSNRMAELERVLDSELGSQEAEAVKRLQVDNTLRSLDASVTQSKMWNAETKKQIIQDRKKKVPAKLKKDKLSTARIKKDFADLEAVIDDAHRSGDRWSVATAELLDDATTAAHRMDNELAYGTALADARSRAAKAVRVLKDESSTEAQKRAAMEQSPVGVITRLARDGFVQIEENVFPEGADYVVRQEMERSLKNFDRIMTGAEPEWVHFYDTANQFFKTWATTSPGFHLRNFMSATFSNISDGVTLGSHARAMSAYKEYRQAAKSGDAALLEWWGKQTPEMQKSFEAVWGSGAGGHFSAAELGGIGGSKFGKLKDNAVTRLSREWGADRVEGPVRLAAAIHYSRAGGDVYDQMNAITRLHFDYSQVSNFDRQMKRIIPFWTFMSRNLPLQFEQMWTKPKAYAVYNNFLKNFDIGEDGEGMPDWLERTGGITVARDVGFLGGNDMVINPDLPFTRMEDEVGAMFPNPAGLAKSVSPFARAPIELAMNRSAFTGRDIFDTDAGEGGGLDQLRYLAEQTIPAIGTAQRLGGFGPNEGKQVEKAGNYVGLPWRGVSDEQRRRALEAAAGR